MFKQSTVQCRPERVGRAVAVLSQDEREESPGSIGQGAR